MAKYQSKPRYEDTSLGKVFYRQNDALQEARQADEDVHVVPFEAVDLSPRARKFLVTSYPTLWDEIQRLYAEGQPGSYYEIIAEGAACKLYFDLEYPKADNPEHDGKQMVAELIKMVNNKLKKTYNIECSSKDVLILDASTDAKFSAHLIFNLRDAVFKDNTNAGNFVRQLCDEIEVSRKEEEVPSKRAKVEGSGIDDSPQRKSSLFIKENGSESLFIDTSVYSRNRHFRIYKCVKLAKNNPLLVADYNEYVPEGVNEDKNTFMDSLITNVKDTPEPCILEFTYDRRPRPARTLFPGPSTSRARSESPSKREGYGNSPSPFPELDAFVTKYVTKGGVQGAIRQWVYFEVNHTVLYEICKNRWCENIGRAHKSNNIKIVVNLRSRTFHQKCHDPDCAGYRSERRHLPADCLPVMDDAVTMNRSRRPLMR